MSHTGVVQSHLQAAEKKRKLEQQYTQDMPRLFHGYTPSGQLDVTYELKGLTPLRSEIRGPHYAHAREPVEAIVMSADALFGHSHDADQMLPLMREISRDMKKLPCISTQQALVKENEGGGTVTRTVFLAFPTMRPTGDAQAPVFVQETDSIATGMAYLLAKTYDAGEGKRKPILSPRDVADTLGYSGLMNAVAPERAQLLKEKLGLELEPALQRAFADDKQTGARLMAYMMAHKRIHPEEVEDRFGHAMLMEACSKENIAWLRAQRGLPEATLAQELPLAHAYLTQKNTLRGMHIPAGRTVCP